MTEKGVNQCMAPPSCQQEYHAADPDQAPEADSAVPGPPLARGPSVHAALHDSAEGWCDQPLGPSVPAVLQDSAEGWWPEVLEPLGNSTAPVSSQECPRELCEGPQPEDDHALSIQERTCQLGDLRPRGLSGRDVLQDSAEGWRDKVLGPSVPAVLRDSAEGRSPEALAPPDSAAVHDPEQELRRVLSGNPCTKDDTSLKVPVLQQGHPRAPGNWPETGGDLHPSQQGSYEDDVVFMMERERDRRPWRQTRREGEWRHRDREDDWTDRGWEDGRSRPRQNGYDASSSRDGAATSRSCTEETRTLRPRSRSGERTRTRTTGADAAAGSRAGRPEERPAEPARRPRLIDAPPEDMPLREAVLLWGEALDLGGRVNDGGLLPGAVGPTGVVVVPANIRDNVDRALRNLNPAGMARMAIAAQAYWMEGMFVTQGMAEIAEMETCHRHLHHRLKGTLHPSCSLSLRENALVTKKMETGKEPGRVRPPRA